MLFIINIINIGVDRLVNIIRYQKKIEDVKIRNEVIKLLFFVDSMIVYL